jgi:hypothetical protein
MFSEMAEDEGPPRGVAEMAKEAEARARRRLLKVTAYSVPLVLGTLLTSRDALAQASACNPNCAPKDACNPNCAPRTGCNPQTCNPAA